MGDDNEQNLLNYKLQLQQVEAALELDRDNAELLTLKGELEEIIGLTLQLLGRDPSDAFEVGEAFGWKVGDHCSALWARDRLYYPAVVTEIRKDGTCFVSFAHLPSGSHAEQCQVSLLKPLAEGAGGADGSKDSSAASLTAQGSNAQAAKKRRREERSKALETKMRKVAKRAEREKEMEAAVEREKRSWQSFSKKIQKQGRVGKSIFATPGPDNPKGRVGVGTCGIAGKGMTPFAAPQYRPAGGGSGGAGAGGSGSGMSQYPPPTSMP